MPRYSIASRLADGEVLRRARVHPLSVLVAHLTYKNGRSLRGSSTWDPVGRIVDALDEAFYVAFDAVEPTGARFLLALDVSGSMDGGIVNGVPGLTPRVASSAMVLATMASGDPCEVVAFTSSGYGYGRRSGWSRSSSGILVAPSGPTELGEGSITQLSISPRERLDDVCRQTAELPFGGTDCALPMLWAMRKGIEAECFVVYTDSETWAGSIHPMQALNEYRNRLGIPAKLVVVGMVSNGFTIADPKDAGMLDVVGMDASTPALIAEFIAGRI